MKKLSCSFVIACLFVGVANAYIDHDFDDLSAGTNFTTEIDGWLSTNSEVVISTAKKVSTPNSIILPTGTSISNNINATSVTNTWTEFRIIPVLGVNPPSSVAASNSTCSLYFNAGGKIEVWTNTAWSSCSNDVWGTALDALDGTNWVEVAIYQNFSTHKAVIFIDGVVALQDIPFSDNGQSAYNYFVIDNVDNNAYLDDVRVQTTYDTVRLTEDNNAINGVDAKEVDEHGYVGRTLYVGVGGPDVLTFATLQEAVDEARNLDRINISSMTITEDITFADDGAENDTYYIIGDAFTNAGTFTVASGATLHIEQFAKISTNIVTGALSLSNNLDTADLQVSGTVYGHDITAIDVALSGSSAAITIDGDLDISTLLTMTTGTSIDVTTGSLTEPTANLSGTFILDGFDWNNSSIARSSLDFSEDFDHFTDGLELDSRNANLFGWGANIASVQAQGTVKRGGGLAAIIPAGGILSNRIDTSAMKVWTEYWIRPAWGVAPENPDTNAMVFLSYVNTNGFMAVPTNGGWEVFSEDMGISPTAYSGMDTNGWTRVDIFTDFSPATNEYALFIDGRIAVEQRAFVGALASATYESFSIISEDNVAYVDDVLIMTEIPPGMTESVNETGIPDAFNIHKYGTIFPPANGSLFKFK